MLQFAEMSMIVIPRRSNFAPQMWSLVDKGLAVTENAVDIRLIF